MFPRHVSTLPEAAAQPSAFADYFRSPPELTRFTAAGDLSDVEGYFTFQGALCYGRMAGGTPARYVTDRLPDVSAGVRCDDGGIGLPFDLNDVVTNFHRERYRQSAPGYLDVIAGSGLPRTLYYFLRPGLSVPLRRHLQKLRLSGWEKLAFPRWPVDVTVETVMQRAMALVLKTGGVERVPFIWFWPRGASSCALVTHDVEGPAGEAFCGSLMDLDDSFGVKSAFQIVPEVPSRASTSLLDDIRRRGFEVNLHDLNHDGHLYRDKRQFLQRAAQINRYVREFRCQGFRSGAMYREQDWYDAFEFSFDMSVPNVAHLEPQRGGCCTVMPYFVGKILELPLTTTQDYSLFHILRDYSLALWQQQIDIILSHHGLISVIAHPDYLLGNAERAVYRDLLAHLARLRDTRGVWVTLPGEVNRWWRDRSQMQLVQAGTGWCVEGPGSERARVAYASLENGQVRYSLE